MNFEEEFSNDTIRYHLFMKACYEWSKSLIDLITLGKKQ